MDVLIVNPQPIWAQRILSRLKSSAARVSIASDWTSAAQALEELSPDVVIIESRTLEREIATLMGALREGERLPVIIPTDLGHVSPDSGTLTMRGEEILRRLELIALRLQGVFEPATRQRIRVGKLTIDPARKEVVFAARRVPLPPQQFRLLLYLALNADRVVDHRELSREVWGHVGSDDEARELIKTYVRFIRRKLGWTDEETNYLQSVRGFGYMLSPPPRARNKKATNGAPAPTTAP